MKNSRLFENFSVIAELFRDPYVFICEGTERRTKMKKIILIIALILCLLMISCREEYSCGGILPLITENEETTGELMWSVCVDWMDFIRVNGIVYDGGFENRTLDESLVGERLGEIQYKVKSYYESEEELQQANKRDFTAAFRPIGSEIFAVKDDEDSIAVLHNGKYYLYTRNDD